jgi:probable rRNA maturation factor
MHLVVHDALHLVGYDHMAEDGANQMESLETKILFKMDVSDPYE